MKDLRLRAPEPDDANIIYIWENSSDERHSSLRSGPVSRLMVQNFIQQYDGEIHTQGSLRFMIDCDGETVGTIDVYDYEPYNRHAFVGIYVTVNRRKEGIASRSLKEVEKLMKRRVGLHSLVALVAEDNEASQRLFTKAGYSPAGVLKEWIKDGERRIDALIFQHLL